MRNETENLYVSRAELVLVMPSIITLLVGKFVRLVIIYNVHLVSSYANNLLVGNIPRCNFVILTTPLPLPFGPEAGN
jgi:hypothetical protein